MLTSVKPLKKILYFKDILSVRRHSSFLVLPLSPWTHGRGGEWKERLKKKTIPYKWSSFLNFEEARWSTVRQNKFCSFSRIFWAVVSVMVGNGKIQGCHETRIRCWILCLRRMVGETTNHRIIEDWRLYGKADSTSLLGVLENSLDLIGLHCHA